MRSATVVLFLLCAFSCRDRGNENPPRGWESVAVAHLTSDRLPRRTLHDLKGEWVSTQFLADLNDARSVYTALDRNAGTHIVWLSFIDEGSTYRVAASWDLHDSGGFTLDSLTAGPDSTTYVAWSTDQRPDTLRITGSQDSMRLYWSAQTERDTIVREFVRVSPDFQTFCRGLLIAGRYTDDRHTIIDFRNDGLCFWNGDTSLYEVGTDFFGIDFDHLILMKRNPYHRKFVGFQLRGAQLVLERLPLDEHEWPTRSPSDGPDAIRLHRTSSDGRFSP